MDNTEIDKRVAEILGLDIDETYINGVWINLPMSSDSMETEYKYHPSTNWQQAGELLERFNISVCCDLEENGKWFAFVDTTTAMRVSEYHETPQRAICFAVIKMSEGENE